MNPDMGMMPMYGGGGLGGAPGGAGYIPMGGLGNAMQVPQQAPGGAYNPYPNPAAWWQAPMQNQVQKRIAPPMPPPRPPMPGAGGAGMNMLQGGGQPGMPFGISPQIMQALMKKIAASRMQGQQQGNPQGNAAPPGMPTGGQNVQLPPSETGGGPGGSAPWGGGAGVPFMQGSGMWGDLGGSPWPSNSGFQLTPGAGGYSV